MTDEQRPRTDPLLLEPHEHPERYSSGPCAWCGHERAAHAVEGHTLNGTTVPGYVDGPCVEPGCADARCAEVGFVLGQYRATPACQVTNLPHARSVEFFSQPSETGEDPDVAVLRCAANWLAAHRDPRLPIVAIAHEYNLEDGGVVLRLSVEDPTMGVLHLPEDASD